MIRRCICSALRKPQALSSALFHHPVNPNNHRNHSNHNGNHGNCNKAIPGILLAASAGAFLIDHKSPAPHNFSTTEILAAEVLSPAPDTKKIRSLLKEGADPNYRYPGGWTILHHAVAMRNSRVVKELLRFKVDVNCQDEYPFPSVPVQMHNVAQIQQHRRVMGGGNFNSQADWRGATPLHYAVLNDDERMVQTLLAAGCDPSLTTQHGQATPRDLAVDKEVIRLLEKAEQDRKRQRILGLGPFLKQNVVGQEDALMAVTAAVQRRSLGWQEDKPLVMLFVGSSGIGKTETAKQLAEYMKQDADGVGFIRVDMSEFQEKHEVSKFIGSPPGYVGYEEGGQLTKALTSAPNSVILLDEVEKAHPDVLNIMLQLFDEGRITDGKGVTVSCPGATFVMTTNVGADQIAHHTGSLDEDFKKFIMYPLLKVAFRRNEFLGRINEIVYFLPFSRAQCKELVTRELERIKDYATKLNISFSWDDSAVLLLSQALDTNYGARSLKNEVSRRVVDKLADMSLENEITAGSGVMLTVRDDALTFDVK